MVWIYKLEHGNFLGIDENLFFGLHISTLCKKLRRIVVYALRVIKRSSNMEAVMIAYSGYFVANIT
jgi:hypothetical protein